MFENIEVEGRQVKLYREEGAEYCLIQPVDASDEERLENQLKEIRNRTGDKKIALAAFKINSWNDELSPWPAPAVFGSEDFGGLAGETLAFVTDSLVPYIKKSMGDDVKLIIGGYSLRAFFSLWAGYESRIFEGVAAASPSVWYPRWDKYTEEHNFNRKAVYLSLGDREEKTRNPVMKQVGGCIRDLAEKYAGIFGENSTLEMNEGNHFKDTDIRTAKAFAWVINKLGE